MKTQLHPADSASGSHNTKMETEESNRDSSEIEETLQDTNPDDLLLPVPIPDYLQPPLFPTALFPVLNGPLHPWEDPKYQLPPFVPNPAALTPQQLQLIQQQLLAQQQAQLQPSSQNMQQIKEHGSLFKNVPEFRPSTFFKKENVAPKRPNRTFPVGVPRGDGVFTSVYSNIPVYEFMCNDVMVMRRQEDGWINATHILKVAAVDKGRRTKILEKELLNEPHEKVQGGFGRYQGTWIPLERARQMARDYNVEDALAPILDLVDVADP